MNSHIVQDDDFAPGETTDVPISVADGIVDAPSTLISKVTD